MTATTLPTKLPAKCDLPLPMVSARPHADIVIFDGHCKFCTQQVKNLARWDSRQQLAFLSLHDPEVARRFPDLTHEQLMDQLYVVDQAGHRYGGAAAFRYLSRRLPWLYGLAPLLHIPFSLPLWQWSYKQVAKRRYLMGKINGAGESCDDGTCSVHFK